MFHWICPECGREIPPTMRECQACDPSAAAIDPPPPVVEPIESVSVVQSPIAQAVVPPVVEAAPVADLIPMPAPVVEEPPRVADVTPELMAEPQSVANAAPVVEIPPIEREPEPVNSEPHPVAGQLLLELPIEAISPAPEAVQPLAVAVTEPAVESAINTASVLPAPVVEAEPPVVEQLIAAPIDVTEPSIETVSIADVAAEGVVEPHPVVEAASQAVEALEGVTEPLPVAVTEPAIEAAVVEPTPVAEVAEPVVDLKPAAEAPVKLQEEIDPFLALAEGIRAVHLARAAALAAPPESAGILELAEAVGLQRESPVVSPVSSPVASAPVAPSVETSAQAVAPVETAVALLAPAEPEPIGALDPEPEIVSPMLPFAPMQPYSAATSRSIMPVPPRPQILAADSGPRITLPGPTLPPQLTRLQDANVVTVIGEQTAQRTKEAIKPAKRGGAPGWLVSAGVMILLLATALGVVFYLYPRTVADAKPVPTPAEAATAAAPAGSSSPLSKFIEVTGFRIVVDSSKKSEVQYLVVNHSAADISDVNVFITLRSVKPGQAPVCRFSFKVPSLGPFESKEMSSPIEKVPLTLSLPSWQDLRADVQISQ